MPENRNYDTTGLGSYGEYVGDSSYEYDPGILALPTAGATPGFALIRLHGGIGRRTVSWNAKRAGKPPIIPSMTDTPGDTFLGGTASLGLPNPNPQVGGYNWDVSGAYTYVQTVPRIVGQRTLSAGSFPFPIAPNDAIASALVEPALGPVAAAAEVDKADVFAKAVSPTAADRAADTYLWPFTLLPPAFTNDYLIGG